MSNFDAAEGINHLRKLYKNYTKGRYADGGEVDGGRFTPTPEQRLATRQSRAAANSDRASARQSVASADPARYWYGFLQKPARDALAVTEPLGTLGDLVEMSHGSSYGLPTTGGLHDFYDTILPPYGGRPAPPAARGYAGFTAPGSPQPPARGGFLGFLPPAAQNYAGGGEVESFPRTKATAQALWELARDYPGQLEMDRRRWYWDRANNPKSTGDRILGDLGNFARVTADNLLPNSLVDKIIAGARSLKGDRYDEALREERAKTRQAREYDLDPYLRPAAGALGTLPWMNPVTAAEMTALGAASNAAEPSHSFSQWADRVLGGPTLRDLGDVAYDAGKGLYRDAKEYLGFAGGGKVSSEIGRYLANRGRLADFIQYGGIPEEERDPSWFPRDMMNIRSHAYHGTAHVPNLLDFEGSGRLWGSITGGKHKVPTYVAATDPELPYSARPVADSHFSRSWGYPDVRTAETKGVLGKELTGPEYGDMVPFYQSKIAEPLDLRPRDAQALQWGVFGPQTGVQYVGPPKLEILSDFVNEAVQNRGISPERALYQLLTSRIPGRREGGRIDDDFGLYGTMEYAGGGRVADDQLLYHVSEF